MLLKLSSAEVSGFHICSKDTGHSLDTDATGHSAESLGSVLEICATAFLAALHNLQHTSRIL